MRRCNPQVLRLMKVLPKPHAHGLAQVVHPHEPIQIVHRPPELGGFWVERRDHGDDGTDDVAPEHRPNEHEGRGDELFRPEGGANVAVCAHARGRFMSEEVQGKGAGGM